MKLHRKIKHNEKVCCAQDLCSYAKGQRSKLCLRNNSKTTKVNLTKLHRKIEHNEKVCCAQELDSYAQGQGHNHLRGEIVPKIVLLINYRSKFDETHRKIKHNERVCCAQDLGSYAKGQRSKLCFCNNSKTTKVNLTKLHRKIEHNENVCCA